MNKNYFFFLSNIMNKNCRDISQKKNNLNRSVINNYIYHFHNISDHTISFSLEDPSSSSSSYTLIERWGSAFELMNFYETTFYIYVITIYLLE